MRFHRLLALAAVSFALPAAQDVKVLLRNGIPAGANPYAVALVDGLERLRLDYTIVLGLHGRQASKSELLRAAGRTN